MLNINKIYSQEINLGLITSVNIAVNTDIKNDRFNAIIPPEILVKLGFNLNEYFNVDLRSGLGYESDYLKGFRLGVFNKISISQDFYSLIGFDYYRLNGDNISHSTNIRESNHYFISLAVGTYISKKIFLELMLKHNISSDKTTRIGEYGDKYGQIKNIIKLNVGYSFNL